MATQNPIPTYFNPEYSSTYKGLSFEDTANAFNSGQQFSNQIKQQQQQGLLAQLLAQNTGKDGQIDLNRALQTVQGGTNQPELVNSLAVLIQQSNAAKAKSQQDALDADAKLNKTHAETGKIKQEGLGQSIDNSGKKFGAINQVFQSAALSGNKSNVLLGLNAALSSGLIDPETYNKQKQFIDVMSPEEVKSYASDIAFSGSKDPSSIIYQTANNVADNQTSRANNQATVGATIRGQDVAANTASQRLAFDKIKQEQELALKNGEFETMTGTDGKAYAVYKDGRVEPLLLSSGNALTPQPKSGTTATTQAEEKQRVSRVNAVLDEISTILPQATNSYFGRGIDYGARIFGGATSGDIASGKLGTLGGQLVALMPKMSGPQSDKDVAMYKQMAGQLDDATVPLEIRQAALETIRSLNNKYADMSNQGAGTPFKNAGQQPNDARLNGILFGQ